YTLCVAPETGGILLERARIIEAVGGRSLGSTPEAIALTGDKLRLCEHLARRWVRTPMFRRVVAADGLPEEFEYPAVLKPIDGDGSVNTFYVDGPGAWPPDARALDEAILQEFIPGVPMSASFLFGTEGDGRLVGLARQRMEWQDRQFFYRGGLILPETADDW